jgi:hypothetical protein
MWQTIDVFWWDHVLAEVMQCRRPLAARLAGSEQMHLIGAEDEQARRSYARWQAKLTRKYARIQLKNTNSSNYTK